VRNPNGAPKYYLRFDERCRHIGDEQIGSFGYDFADYAPWEFDVRAVSPENCRAILLGLRIWLTAGIKTILAGLAVAMRSDNFPGSKVSGSFNSDYIWRNQTSVWAPRSRSTEKLRRSWLVCNAGIVESRLGVCAELRNVRKIDRFCTERL
jgi:hypothetical protein